MQVKKYDLKEALLLIVGKYGKYDYVEDVSVNFGLNSSDEMLKLQSELEKLEVIDYGSQATRNDITGNYHVSKARNILINMK